MKRSQWQNGPWPWSLAIAVALATLGCSGETATEPDSPAPTPAVTGSANSPKAVAATPPADATATQLFGIDISKYQGDEAATLDRHKDDLTFVIVKATEGITYTDPDFETNWETVRRKGFIRGAYHFYIAADATKPQLDNFMNAVGEWRSGDLRPIVDVEARSLGHGEASAEIQKPLLDFLHALEQRTGATPILYTGLNFANHHLTDAAFAKSPLWLADYTSDPEPEIPTTWSAPGYTFWQRTADHTIEGTKNDFDIFNGNEQDLTHYQMP